MDFLNINSKELTRHKLHPTMKDEFVFHGILCFITYLFSYFGTNFAISGLFFVATFEAKDFVLLQATDNVHILTSHYLGH